MKKSLKILIVGILVLFISCNNNDEALQDLEIKKLKDKLTSTIWNLQNVSGGIIGTNDDFEKGLIKWFFNKQNSTLSVENNSKKSIYSGLVTGTYTFKIIKNNNTYFLKIENVIFGGISVLNNQLIIDQNKQLNGTGADGFILKLQN